MIPSANVIRKFLKKIGYDDVVVFERNDSVYMKMNGTTTRITEWFGTGRNDGVFMNGVIDDIEANATFNNFEPMD